MVFVNAVPASELLINDDGVIVVGDGVAVTVQQPLVFTTHFSMAEDFVGTDAKPGKFVLHHLQFEDVSLACVVIRGVESTKTIDCASMPRVQMDDLEQSMQDYTTPKKGG